VINDSISFTTRLNEKYPSFSLFLTEKTELPLFCSIPLDVLIICLTGISKEVVFSATTVRLAVREAVFPPLRHFQMLHKPQLPNTGVSPLLTACLSKAIFWSRRERGREGERERERDGKE
jgi:hypothetical protein